MDVAPLSGLPVYRSVRSDMAGESTDSHTESNLARTVCRVLRRTSRSCRVLAGSVVGRGRLLQQGSVRHDHCCRCPFHRLHSRSAQTATLKYDISANGFCGRRNDNQAVGQ